MKERHKIVIFLLEWPIKFPILLVQKRHFYCIFLVCYVDEPFSVINTYWSWKELPKLIKDSCDILNEYTLYFWVDWVNNYTPQRSNYHICFQERLFCNNCSMSYPGVTDSLHITEHVDKAIWCLRVSKQLSLNCWSL